MSPPQNDPPPAQPYYYTSDPRIRWEGEISATVGDHERRLNAINGHIDALRKTQNRWAGALTLLVVLSPLATALIVREVL